MSNLNKLEFYKLFNIDKINFNESDLKKVKKKKKKEIKKEKKKKKESDNDNNNKKEYIHFII